jgi:hypothetical protein
VAYWKLDARAVLTANLVGILVFPVALVAFAMAASRLTGQTLSSLGGAMDDALTGRASVLTVVVLAAGVIVVHETTHAIVMRLFGRQPVFGTLYMGLAFYAAAPGQPFTRNQWLAVALAPLVVLSLLGCTVMPFISSTFAAPLVFWLAVNAAGSGADAWMSLRVLRYPRESYVIDEGDGLRVLLPGGAGDRAVTA